MNPVMSVEGGASTESTLKIRLQRLGFWVLQEKCRVCGRVYPHETKIWPHLFQIRPQDESVG